MVKEKPLKNVQSFLHPSGCEETGDPPEGWGLSARQGAKKKGTAFKELKE